MYTDFKWSILISSDISQHKRLVKQKKKVYKPLHCPFGQPPHMMFTWNSRANIFLYLIIIPPKKNKAAYCNLYVSAPSIITVQSNPQKSKNWSCEVSSALSVIPILEYRTRKGEFCKGKKIK